VKKNLLILITAFSASLGYTASFDCAKATTINEKAICSDSKLSQLDSDLSAAYKAVLSAAPESADQIKSEQRQWVKGNKHCESSPSPTACLASAYQERIAALNGKPAVAIPAPQLKQVEQTQPAAQADASSDKTDEPVKSEPTPEAKPVEQVITPKAQPAEAKVSNEDEGAALLYSLVFTIFLVLFPFIGFAIFKPITLLLSLLNKLLTKIFVKIGISSEPIDEAKFQAMMKDYEAQEKNKKQGK
jgi:uncharacterized protein